MRRAPGLYLMLMALTGCTPGMLDSFDEDDVYFPPDADRVLISTIQGKGEASPMLGREVAVEGVVVRNLMGDEDDMAHEVGVILGEGRKAKVEGWFIQDEGDGLDDTSDAIFIQDAPVPMQAGYSMPAEARYTMRMGSPLRTGDRVKVSGTVMEVAQDIAGDQRRSSGRRISRGDPTGTVTAIRANWITILSPKDRKTTFDPPRLSRTRLHDESAEGMRIEPARPIGSR